MASYSVQKLAVLAGITARTLHFYDEMGLLKPAYTRPNGYRVYEEKELVRLQQIMFFRELEFSLDEIKEILDGPNFDVVEALHSQKQLIEIKRKRLAQLEKTLTKTIITMKNKQPIREDQLYADFSNEEMENYKIEAKERWGNTKAYRQSEERTKNLTKEDIARIKKQQEEIGARFVEHMNKGHKSHEIQKYVQLWRDNLTQFYDPNLEICRGLATMYVEDERFALFYRKYHQDLPTFLRDAIHYYCDTHTK